MPVYLLIDNGSRKAEATLRLRELASALSARTGKTVEAVSLQHSDAIDPSRLGGNPANTFTHFMKHHLGNGERDFRVVPLFFGESRALTSFIPQSCEQLRKEHGEFDIKLAPVTCPLPDCDERLDTIVLEHILAARSGDFSQSDVVLVDHGSPLPCITEVRETIARGVAVCLPDDVALEQAVMERRDGKEYDFNGPLLEDWLREQAHAGMTSVIIAMLFFLPGRHAGSCGDIESICEGVAKEYPSLRYRITPLISEHPLLLDILSDRLDAIC